MIVGYLRVSTEKQHLENQQDEIGRYARENNMEIDRWVMEIVSGKKDHSGRKLGRLISRMKRGDTLIVSEVSRLSRSLTDIMSIMGTCLKRGIHIHTAGDIMFGEQDGEVVDKILFINDPNSNVRIWAKNYKRDMDYRGLADHTPVVVEFGYEKIN